MICKICGSTNVKIEYNGLIRDGGLGRYFEEPVSMMKCLDCDVIWHDEIRKSKEYYESEQYRNELEGSSEEEEFYHLHDKDTLDKFTYTGTDIFRNKTVMDIGSGCGAFLDFLKGVAKNIIAIEPSEKYRNIMDGKGFITYPYMQEALSEWKNKVDVITSFDVIEHVTEPQSFLDEVHSLMSVGSKAIIGTPTDAPVMRALLGNIYEQRLLFSTQHLWVFDKKNLMIMADRAGFDPEEMNIKYYQRYGIGNLMGWVKEKKPNSEITDGWITETLDAVWKKECEKQGKSDYIVLYLEKKHEK